MFPPVRVTALITSLVSASGEPCFTSTPTAPPRAATKGGERDVGAQRESCQKSKKQHLCCAGDRSATIRVNTLAL
jgi:hypothetical protein